MQRNHTTGLDDIQFDDLVAMIGERLAWDAPIGRPKALTLEQAVKATLIYFKNNVTEDVIAELMFVDQTTVSRAIATIEAVIADVLEDWVPTLDEALHGTTAVVDGSLLPCWSWRSRPDLCSGKHHTTGHNHQFVSTLSGRLVHVSDPLPGSLHDSNAVEKSGVLKILDPGNTLGDKGYLGTGITVPTRKPPGGTLTTEQATLNKEINSLRYVIERSIANFKTWRAVHTDYRRPLSTYPTAFSAIRALYFYSTSSA